MHVAEHAWHWHTHASPRLGAAAQCRPAHKRGAHCVQEGYKPPIFTADTSDPDAEEGQLRSGDSYRGEYANGMMTQLLEEAEKRAAHTEHLPPATRRRRLVGWLQRTGHPWAVVRDILEALEM